MLRKSILPILFVAALVLCLSWVVLAGSEGKPKTLDNDPHLVGWWKFDETAGKTAADSSRHKRKGKLTGELSFDKNSAEGKIGGVFHRSFEFIQCSLKNPLLLRIQIFGKFTGQSTGSLHTDSFNRVVE